MAEQPSTDKPELSFAEQELGLTPGQFPFESNFVEVSGARLHYVDEGTGSVLLLVHGNPAWSFLYRRVIRELSSDYRCIAVDLPGFGLSQAPSGFGYLPSEQAAVIGSFVDALDLQDVTLVAHDWGGPVGLGAFVGRHERLARICLGNTWAWPVDDDPHFRRFSGFMGGIVGQFLNNNFSFFVNAVMPMSMKRGKLDQETMRAYRAPFHDRASRTPLSVFPREIVQAAPWLATLESDLADLDVPVAFLWPDSDIAFKENELQHWLRIFPDAEVTRLEKCGHFIWEDAPDDAIAGLRNFLELHA